MSKLKMAKGCQVKVFDPELVRRREENKGPGILEGKLYPRQEIHVSGGGAFDLFSASARRGTESVEQQDTGFLLLPWLSGPGKRGAQYGNVLHGRKQLVCMPVF